jgi:hypothetical protein
LSRADQEKGRLRTFLLGSLQNFPLKQRERRQAIKRGGNQQLVSFDLHLPEDSRVAFRRRGYFFFR